MQVYLGLCGFLWFLLLQLPIPSSSFRLGFPLPLSHPPPLGQFILKLRALLSLIFSFAISSQSINDRYWQGFCLVGCFYVVLFWYVSLAVKIPSLQFYIPWFFQIFSDSPENLLHMCRFPDILLNIYIILSYKICSQATLTRGERLQIKLLPSGT